MGALLRSTPNQCKHKAARRCDLFSNKCCQCCDRTLNPNSGLTKAANEFYASYCPGCCNFFTEIATAKKVRLVKEHAEWRQTNGQSDPKRTALAVNFFFRQFLPFELAHITLTFRFPAEHLPVQWFLRTFSNRKQPLTVVPKVLKQGSLVRPMLRSAPVRSGKCTHDFCQLSIRSSGRYGAHACCACLDRRANKTVDTIYVDGQGDVLAEVAFYQHYCTGCRDYYSDHSWVMPDTGVQETAVRFGGGGRLS